MVVGARFYTLDRDVTHQVRDASSMLSTGEAAENQANAADAFKRKNMTRMSLELRFHRPENR